MKLLAAAREIKPATYSVKLTDEYGHSNTASALLTENQARALEGKYKLAGVDRMLARLGQYNLDNRRIEIARSVGGDSFNSVNLAEGLQKALSETRWNFSKSGLEGEVAVTLEKHN